MTPTTQTVRDQGFLPFRCDVPDGLTLREWSTSRRRADVVSRRRRLRRDRRR